jgi:tetratricopeptide (TPR) repeat protein
MSPQTILRVSTFVAAAGLVVQPAFSQGRGGGGSTPSGGSGAGASPSTGSTPSVPSTTTRPPTTTTPTQPNNTQTMPQTPIFISGRVMLEDGSAPTESVVIERVCSGVAHSEGYTDSKGYFSIQLGAQNNGMMHDASEDMSGFSAGSPGGMGGFGGGGFGQSTSRNGSMSENRFIDCDLRARVAGFRSQSVSLANRRAMDPPDVGTILLHRLSPTEGTTISAASLAAPKDAKKAYEKGMEALKKRKAPDAVKNFEKAVEVYPKYAAAWYELGRFQAAQGDAAMARGYFEQAVKADPKFVSPYMELAVIDWKAEKWQQVAELTQTVVKLDSFDYPQAYFLNALSNYYLKDMDAAEKSAREAVRLDTRKQYLTTIRLLGVILAQKQDYAGATEQLKSYLELAPQASDAATVRNQLAQLEKLTAAKQ